MLLSEFTDRVKIKVDGVYFDSHIHPAYMEFDGDKDEFCRFWKRNNGVQDYIDYLWDLYKGCINTIDSLNKNCSGKDNLISKLDKRISELHTTISDLQSKVNLFLENKSLKALICNFPLETKIAICSEFLNQSVSCSVLTKMFEDSVIVYTIINGQFNEPQYRDFILNLYK